MDRLRARAAYDLNCSRSGVRIVELDEDSTYGASGCGQKATYIWDCSGGPSEDCKWVRN